MSDEENGIDWIELRNKHDQYFYPYFISCIKTVYGKYSNTPIEDYKAGTERLKKLLTDDFNKLKEQIEDLVLDSKDEVWVKFLVNRMLGVSICDGSPKLLDIFKNRVIIPRRVIDVMYQAGIVIKNPQDVYVFAGFDGDMIE